MVAAVASYLQAKSNEGKWLIRVEDIDPPREVRGSAEQILKDLENFGMVTDEPVFFQTSHLLKFESCCQQLLQSKLAFECSCSRKSLPSGVAYPGTCRTAPADASRPLSIRVKTTDEAIEFLDRLQGPIRQNLSEDCGDFVIWRADGLPAYQLAVVVDDALQGITEVVRGADLLDSTCRQIHLQRILGLPTPAYIHVPVATLNGTKLAKKRASDPVSTQSPVKVIKGVLEFLGHSSPGDLNIDQLWTWAMENWNINAIPAKKAIPLDLLAGFSPKPL